MAIRARKTFSKPRKPWDRTRMQKETELKKTYYFKNKTELWKLEEKLKRLRQRARKLIAVRSTEEGIEKTGRITSKLQRLGILKKGAVLEDILGLTIEDVMERRLQILVLRKGLANTPKQARQFITHGHIFVGEKMITSPNYLVNTEEEKLIKCESEFKGVANDGKGRKQKQTEERESGEEGSRERREPRAEPSK